MSIKNIEKINIDNISFNHDRSKTPKINILMDSVLEETEESDVKIMASPRIKLYSDKTEDLNTPKIKGSHSHFFASQSEMIVEDNNENIVEEKEKIHKRNASMNKILESSMDKSEVIDNFNEINFIEFEEHQIRETIEEAPEDDDDIDILNFIKGII